MRTTFAGEESRARPLRENDRGEAVLRSDMPHRARRRDGRSKKGKERARRPTRPRPPLGSVDLDSTTSVSCALSGGTISRRASHEQTGPVEGQLPHGGEASLQMGAIISSCDDSLGLGRSGSGIIEARSENRRMPGAAAANQDPPHLDPRTAFQGRKRQPSGSVSGHRCAPCRTRRIRTVVSVTT